MSGIRLVNAAKIIANPHDYKVCECCGSIVTAKSNECVSCRGYQFDVLEVRVIAAARSLGSRPAESVQGEDLL